MTTLLNFRDEARGLINEITQRIILDTDLTRWCNLGVKDFTTRVHWYERIVGMPVVARQSEYLLPADILKMIMVRWQNRYRIETVDLSRWAAATYFNSNPTGIPSIASMSPHDKILRLWAPPQTSSPATTLAGEGQLSAVATTIPVASTATFQKRGIIIIENEQIYYDDTDSTNFLLCRRGDGDTTATTHNTGLAVTEGTVVLTTAAIPPTLVADVDVVKFPAQWESAISLYMAWWSELKRQNQAKAEFYNKAYTAIREEAALENFWDAKDGSPAVKDEEYGTGFYGQE
jgi:hypothetical protein